MERLPGVKHADVKLEDGLARVTYDDKKQTPQKLASAIDMLGFKAALVSVGNAPASETSPPKR